MEKKIKELFDYQRFEKNEKIDQGKRLTDEQLSHIVGGVSVDGVDPNVDEEKMIQDAITELDALVGDPEAVDKKMKELMGLGLLEEVSEALEARAETFGVQNGTPSEEPEPSEVQPADTEIQSADTQTKTGGVIVNQNMAALNTRSQLSRLHNFQPKTIEKLPSGMKINSAVDDQWVYQISERMREQISELDQAEYNAQNVTTSSENPQSAKSTNRDADMAKEMTSLARNQVLQQAATSMLSQATQLPQSILSLLK